MSESAGYPEAQVTHVMAYLRELQKAIAAEKLTVAPEALGGLVAACVLEMHMTQLREELGQALPRDGGT